MGRVVAPANGCLPQGFFQGGQSGFVLSDGIFGAFFRGEDEIFKARSLQSCHDTLASGSLHGDLLCWRNSSLFRVYSVYSCVGGVKAVVID